MPKTARRIQTLEAFAAERGMKTDADVQGHIHAGLRSAPTTKTYARWNARALAELQAAAAATKAAYRAAIDAGEIDAPRRTLADAAAGHPDNASTQAAIRMLAKRAASAAAGAA